MTTEDEGEDYPIEEIVPIPAKCVKCKRVFLGKDAIRSPSLDNCCCFYCHGRLVLHPDHKDFEDAATRRRHKQGRLF